MFDEKNYPMTYKEFEEKVVNLLLNQFKSKDLDYVTEQIDDILNEKPNFIQTMYGQTCFFYDHPEIYGDAVKKGFEDAYLEMNVVPKIRMIMG